VSSLLPGALRNGSQIAGSPKSGTWGRGRGATVAIPPVRDVLERRHCFHANIAVSQVQSGGCGLPSSEGAGGMDRRCRLCRCGISLGLRGWCQWRCQAQMGGRISIPCLLLIPRVSPDKSRLRTFPFHRSLLALSTTSVGEAATPNNKRGLRSAGCAVLRCKPSGGWGRRAGMGTVPQLGRSSVVAHQQGRCEFVTKHLCVQP